MFFNFLFCEIAQRQGIFRIIEINPNPTQAVFFYLFDKLPDLNSKTYIEINCLSLSNNTFNKSENWARIIFFRGKENLKEGLI